jgi:5-methylcytosine-specific restriction enzyme A
VGIVQLVDDGGRVLDAEYLVEPDGSYLAVVMDSRSGQSGSRSPRNPDYNRALMLLLARLGQLGAVMADALVDSRHTQELAVPESDRKLIEAPIRLALEPDLDVLRRRMGRAQARIGQSPNATKGGNATKRIRLRLEVPGYQAGDAGRLADALAAPAAEVVPMFILGWDPVQYLWEDDGYDEAIQVTAAGGAYPDNWTAGRRSGGISPRDRAFLYRQHKDRGLVASGVFTSEVYPAEHWDGSGRLANWADVDWDIILDYEDRLPLEALKAEVPEVNWDHFQGGGWEIEAPVRRKLADLWARHTGQVFFRSPDEPRGLGDQAFPEGALHRVEVNRYERDRRARIACLDHWGYSCAVCDLSFEDRYGPTGKNYIHVHHLLELSQVPADYYVNPVADLRPVCPNCHAMIHRDAGKALTIDELKQLLRPTSARVAGSTQSQDASGGAHSPG